MAWCNLCQKDDGYDAKSGETVPDSCVPNEILAPDGRRFLAIPYGHKSEGWSRMGIIPPPRCHDCRVKTGGFHHPGCDMERCPICIATNGWGQHSEARRMGQRGDAVQAMLCAHCNNRRIIR